MIYNNEYRIDFIGIGTPKSGTTWLAEVLKQHPDIYYPTARKEVNFFCKYLSQDFKTPNHDYNKSYSWYHEFFEDRKDAQLAGEITPSYLSMENCAKDIHTYNPNIKLFAILRNPIDRAYSEYLFSKQNGVNSYKSFEEAMELNPDKFINSGLYYKQIEHYLNYFGWESMKFFFYDDLKSDPKQLLCELYDFLGVKQFFPEGYASEVNTGKEAKNQFVNNFIGKSKMLIHRKGLHFILPVLKHTKMLSLVKLVKAKNLKERTSYTTISEETRKRLLEFYLKDIESLEKLTGKNLSKWKS